MFPTLSRQIFYKLNLHSDFTQYMLVGSWVKVENILLYENIEAPPICMFTIGSILQAKIVRRQSD